MPFINPNASRSKFRHRGLFLLVAVTAQCACAWAQSATPGQVVANDPWAGRRIVTLEGFGDYFTSGKDGRAQLIRPEGLGVNIVAVVQRLDGDRIWIKSNGAGDTPVGWVKKEGAVLLEDALAYFTARIERDPKDWDAYLRRAEAEHALNQRDAAIADYGRAIELHPNEPFLFLRRGRSFRILQACRQAAADFERAAELEPRWAEVYNLAAGVYSDCPDPTFRDPDKAISLIEHAIALDLEHPTYLTVLALAYFRSRQA